MDCKLLLLICFSIAIVFISGTFCDDSLKSSSSVEFEFEVDELYPSGRPRWLNNWNSIWHPNRHPNRLPQWHPKWHSHWRPFFPKHHFNEDSSEETSNTSSETETTLAESNTSIETENSSPTESNTFIETSATSETTIFIADSESTIAANTVSNSVTSTDRNPTAVTTTISSNTVSNSVTDA